MAAGLPCRVQGRHKRCVNCELGTAPKRQTVGDDLDAQLVLLLDNKVEVTQEHIGHDNSPCLTANPSSCSLEWEWDSSRAQQTEVGAGGTVVTQSIEAAPAGAECRDRGQMQAQAAQQHHTVTRWFEPELRGSRQGCEHFGCEGAGLGFQQGH